MAETALEVPTVTEKETPLQAEAPEAEPQPVVTVEVVESEKTKSIEPTRKAPESLVSFKEESSRVADLSDFQKNALEELRALIRDALNNNEFIYAPPPVAVKVEAVATPPPPPAQEVPAGSSTPYRWFVSCGAKTTRSSMSLGLVHCPRACNLHGNATYYGFCKP